MNVGWFFSELQEFWVVAKQKLVLFKGEASPCFYRHFESQLRVWVHGDAFVPLGHIMNVGWFFSELQEFWVVAKQKLVLFKGEASPCFYRHFESQLRVWVHGDAFVPLGHIMNVGWFFSELQEFWVVAKQKLVLFKGEASPCIYRHFESQLRVWVHGDAVVPFGPHHECRVVLFRVARVLGCCQTEIGFVQR